VSASSESEESSSDSDGEVIVSEPVLQPSKSGKKKTEPSSGPTAKPTISQKQPSHSTDDDTSESSEEDTRPAKIASKKNSALPVKTVPKSKATSPGEDSEDSEESDSDSSESEPTPKVAPPTTADSSDDDDSSDAEPAGAPSDTVSKSMSRSQCRLHLLTF
jgi:hypothetical protein